MMETSLKQTDESNLETKLKNSHLDIKNENELLDASANEKSESVITPIDIEEAEKLKEKGNERFKNQHYSEAIDFYTQSIKLNPNEVSYYGNRSFAYLKSEFYGSALQDAAKSIEIDPKYIKGYYRRASSNLALGKVKLALKDYEYVAKVRPNDKEALNKFNECQKIVKRLAFEKAISVNDDALKKSFFEQIDVNALAVESDYAGPKFEFDKEKYEITAEFVSSLLDYFKNQKVLHKKYAYKILFEIYNLFKKSPSLIDIKINENDKFTVCGDVHGQFYDLLNIFKINGLPSEANPYLFNGDFVDRGSFSIECIITLFAFKLLYPNHFFLARGNHESINMNQMYGFEGEVKAKYSQQMFQLFCEIFNYLPLAHCINSRVLVMHGGLFKKFDVSLEEIRQIDRNKQPPEEGLMCDLLWSDPQWTNGISESKRGVGVQFGPDITKKFLEFNKLDYIIRSHEAKAEGYEVMHDGKCITVFSAPNYCDTMGNKGAFITMNGSDMKPNFTSFEAVEHPKNVKPMAYANAYSMFGM